MIRAAPLALLLALLIAGPGAAQVLPSFEGRWQGEGELRLGDEPAQRFRCLIRLRGTARGDSVFQGRCATAQASQSFTYMLSETAGGGLSAENASGLDDDLPARMQGEAAPGLLRLSDGDEGLFELRRDGEALRFTIAGTDSRGPARGEARLTLRE